MFESFLGRKLLARSGLAPWLKQVKRTLLGSEAHLHRFSDRLLAAPLAELLDPALLPHTALPDSIDLAQGNPRAEFTPVGRSASVHRPASAWGDIELREELAVRLHLDHGVEYEPADEVLITHGATGAFAATLDAFINPGDRVVLFDPTAPIFPIGLKHRRAKAAWVKTWSDDGLLRFDMAQFAKAVRGAKLIVLADPSNPTGCVFAPEDLEQIAFWARKVDALVFQDLSFDRWRAGPARARLAALPNVEGRVLTSGSYAKSHGLVGARVGWLAGDRHLMRPCAVSASLTAPFVPAVCQHIALQAEREGEVAMLALRDEINRRRPHVADRLKGMGLSAWPARGGFFAWVAVPGEETGREFAARLFRETGVLVNPGHVFGPSGLNQFRLSFAADEGRVREGLDRLAGFLNCEPAHSPARLAA